MSAVQQTMVCSVSRMKTNVPDALLHRVLPEIIIGSCLENGRHFQSIFGRRLDESAFFCYLSWACFNNFSQQTGASWLNQMFAEAGQERIENLSALCSLLFSVEMLSSYL